MLRSAFLSGLMVVAGAVIAPAAMADEAVVVANRAAPMPVVTGEAMAATGAAPETTLSARMSDTSAPEPEINDEAQVVYRLPRSQVSLEPEAALPERRVRGSAGAAIGTGGYRSGYVAGAFPVGETGTLGVAYSETDHGDNAVFIPHDGYGYGRMSDPLRSYDRMGYGYGNYGSVARGVKQKSLAISLDFGDRVSAGMDRSVTCARGNRAEEETLRAWDEPVVVQPYGAGPASRFDRDC